MPKLWDHSIKAHHEAISQAIFSAAGSIVDKEGLTALTMSRVAEVAGIGRATLYKHFRDATELLVSWHRHLIDRHLVALEAIRAESSDPAEALEKILATYAETQRGHFSHAAAGLHTLPHVRHAHDRLHRFVREVIADAARTDAVRGDVPADELADFALAALGNLGGKSKASANRRVELALRALANITS